jgi:nitroreductase
MELFDTILTRRSIRRYTTEKIENDLVNKIIKAGMYAPSAVNKQPWHFIVFEDKKSMNDIMEVHQSSAMLAEAQIAILVCYDEKLQHDEGYGAVDCSNATQNMLLAAHALGLGACWVGIYPRVNRMEALHSIFRLPPNVKAFSVIALGYPAEQKNMPERYKPERIHFEKWEDKI